MNFIAGQTCEFYYVNTDPTVEPSYVKFAHNGGFFLQKDLTRYNNLDIYFVSCEPSEYGSRRGVFAIYVYDRYSQLIDRITFHIYELNIGSGTGIFKLRMTCYVKDTTIPVPNVRIVARAGEAFISTVTSNVTGGAIMNLDAGNYEIRAYRAGYWFEPIEININSDTDLIIYANEYVYTPAEQPYLCRVHVNIADFQLIPSQNVTVAVKIISQPQVIGDYILDWTEKTFTTDENGYTYFDVVQGARVQITITPAGLQKEFNIPYETSARLVDLIRRQS